VNKQTVGAQSTAAPASAANQEPARDRRKGWPWNGGAGAAAGNQTGFGKSLRKSAGSGPLRSADRRRLWVASAKPPPPARGRNPAAVCAVESPVESVGLGLSTCAAPATLATAANWSFAKGRGHSADRKASAGFAERHQSLRSQRRPSLVQEQLRLPGRGRWRWHGEDAGYTPQHTGASGVSRLATHGGIGKLEIVHPLQCCRAASGEPVPGGSQFALQTEKQHCRAPEARWSRSSGVNEASRIRLRRISIRLLGAQRQAGSGPCAAMSR